jgi:hypothetical protein
MKKLLPLTLTITFLLAACSPSNSGISTAEVMTVLPEATVIPGIGGSGTEAPVPTPAPATAIPTLLAGLSPTELKYRLLEEYPDFFFCDPDYYPIAREDENVLAQERFPEIQANAEEFNAILNHNGLSGLTAFTNEQKLLIYREHKKLAAIFFELAGEKYQFQVQTGTEGQAGFIVTGTIDGDGRIKVEKRDPGFPSCPICLAAGSSIDTPRGPVVVQNLRPGDSVWTMNAAGERVPAVILRVGSMVAPASHQIVHIVLSDGRELWASPGHPTADGRSLGDLKVGDLLDSALVIRLESLPYGGLVTYDLLPSGDTGFYWVNGILMGSTLANR